MRRAWIFLLFICIVLTGDKGLAVEDVGILKIAPTRDSIVLRWPFCSKMALEDIYVEIFRQGSQGEWQKIAVIVPDLRSIANAFTDNPGLFHRIKTQVLAGRDDRLVFLLYLKGLEDLELARYLCIAYEDRDIDRRRFYRYRVVYLHKGEVLETYESIGFTSLSEYQDISIALDAYSDAENDYLKWDTPDNIVFYRIYRNGRSLFPYPFLISEGQEEEDYFLEERSDENKAEYLVEGVDWAGNRFRSQVVRPHLISTRLQKKRQARSIDSDKTKRLPSTIEIKDVNLEIDAAGKVTIQWRSPLDLDYEGVLIWRSLDGGRSFVLITPRPVKSNSYPDNFSPLGNDIKKIYYRLSLIDNAGRASKPTIVSLPVSSSRVILAPPLLMDCEVKNGRVYLDISSQEGVADEVLCEIISDGKLIRHETKRPGRIVLADLPQGDFEVKLYSVDKKGRKSEPLILHLPALSLIKD